MSQKAATQFVIFVGGFFLLWFALSHINYLGNERIKELSTQNEQKLGDLLIDQLLLTNRSVNSDTIENVIKLINNRLLSENETDSTPITLYIIKNEEVNAFAFPGRNIVVYSGLIKYSNKPEEIAAVLAHEIAHIQQDHVMKKLTKEIGIALITTLIAGNGNGEIMGEMIHMISSNYYSRDLESEADEFAVEYLANANIDPANLANFLFRFSQDYQDLPKELEWVSSHPIAKERAAAILELSAQQEFEAKAILSDESWEYIKEILSENNY